MSAKGFTLIELMIVVAILGIIVALAMPNLIESRKAANEASAVSALRTISSAQELYNTRYSSYGTSNQLDIANMIDSVLAGATTSNSPKNGYYFLIDVSGSGAAWSCIARPSSWGTTGERNFKIDQTGVIYYNITIGNSTWTQPLGS